MSWYTHDDTSRRRIGFGGYRHDVVPKPGIRFCIILPEPAHKFPTVAQSEALRCAFESAKQPTDELASVKISPRKYRPIAGVLALLGQIAAKTLSSFNDGAQRRRRTSAAVTSRRTTSGARICALNPRIHGISKARDLYLKRAIFPPRDDGSEHAATS